METLISKVRTFRMLKLSEILKAELAFAGSLRKKLEMLWTTNGIHWKGMETSQTIH